MVTYLVVKCLLELDFLLERCSNFLKFLWWNLIHIKIGLVSKLDEKLTN